VQLWGVTHPEFLRIRKVAKEAADNRIERSLYEKASGYTLETQRVISRGGGKQEVVTVTEHVPPDTASMIFWLKNRRRDQWRDRMDVQNNLTVTLEQIVMGSYGQPIEIAQRTIEHEPKADDAAE